MCHPWGAPARSQLGVAHRRHEFLHRSAGIESELPERIGRDRRTRRPVGVLGVDGLPRNGSVDRSRRPDAEVFRDSVEVVVGRKTVCAGDSHEKTRRNGACSKRMVGARQAGTLLGGCKLRPYIVFASHYAFTVMNRAVPRRLISLMTLPCAKPARSARLSGSTLTTTTPCTLPCSPSSRAVCRSRLCTSTPAKAFSIEESALATFAVSDCSPMVAVTSCSRPSRMTFSVAFVPTGVRVTSRCRTAGSSIGLP